MSNQLTDNPYEDANPAFSPDGQQIVYQSYRNDAWGIYVMNADGTGEVLLAADAVEPDWYPSGTHTVYASGAELYRVNTTGTPAPVQLTNHGSGESHNPAISPDGNWIIYEHNDTLYVVDANCTGMCASDLLNTGVSGSHQYPAWSPDGSQLAVGIDGDIYTMTISYNADPVPKPDGFTDVEALEINPLYSDTHPSWSPDGQVLMFESDREGTTSLYTVDLSGGTASLVLVMSDANLLAASSLLSSPGLRTIAYGYAGDMLSIVQTQQSLSISKTVDNPLPLVANPMPSITYTITITNNEPAGSGTIFSNVQVVDVLPDDISYVSHQPDDDSVVYDEISRTLTWTIASLEPQAAATLTIVVTVNEDAVPGTRIANSAAVNEADGIPVVDIEDSVDLIPVVCTGTLVGDSGYNVRDFPVTGAQVGYLNPSSLPSQIGVIGVTILDHQEYKTWYRIAYQEDNNLILGWVFGAEFVHTCQELPLLDENGALVSVPDYSPGECLAVTKNNEAVYNLENIREITNNDDSVPTPIVELSAGSPVVVTRVHLNRQYVDIRYFDEQGTVVGGDTWIRVRNYSDEQFEQIPVLNSGCSRHDNGYYNGQLMGNTVAELPELSLPECLVGRPDQPDQKVNCLPPFPQAGCTEIFGCDPGYSALTLNSFRDTEDGCNQASPYCDNPCPAWSGLSEADEWHCGIDLVTQPDAEEDQHNRGVYAVHGGLFYLFHSGSGTYKMRDLDGDKVREYNYTHISSDPLLVPDLADYAPRGEYVASGVRLGDYGEHGVTGRILHVHYVDKWWNAPDDENILGALTLIADQLNRYSVDIPLDAPRYVPIWHPGNQETQEGATVTLSIRVRRERVGCNPNTYTHSDVNNGVPSLPPSLTIAAYPEYPPTGLVTGTISQNTAGTYDVVIIIEHTCGGKPDPTREGRTRFQWIIGQ